MDLTIEDKDIRERLDRLTIQTSRDHMKALVREWETKQRVKAKIYLEDLMRTIRSRDPTTEEIGEWELIDVGEHLRNPEVKDTYVGHWAWIDDPSKTRRRGPPPVHAPQQWVPRPTKKEQRELGVILPEPGHGHFAGGVKTRDEDGTERDVVGTNLGLLRPTFQIRKLCKHLVDDNDERLYLI